MSKLSIIWMRRNLRLKDNKPLAHALLNSEKILPIFIFDSNILKRFANPNDRRLSFIASTLFEINSYIQKQGGQLIVLYGNPVEIIPKLLQALSINIIYADEDFEPANIVRDDLIKQNIKEFANLELIYDHLLIRPGAILNQEKKPYKVFTSFMKEFRGAITRELIKKYEYDLTQKVVNIDLIKLKAQGLQIVDLEVKENILNQIGYIYQDDKLWQPKDIHNHLDRFINQRIINHKKSRNILALNGTSAISPYLRFGLLSIRECYRQAFNLDNEGAAVWVNELIWREFYAHILFHFPETQNVEFQEKYRNKIPWRKNDILFEKFTSAQTGFPIIDAAITQVLQDGWMHNRARMIVASFLTKNLFIDWRLGEEFFAQYLMDYDLASNVGGWQWAASCGTDAPPYFRVFNPFLQGEKFDPQGEYVKKYLPQLRSIDSSLVHNQKAIEANFGGKINYPAPIINHKASRLEAIEILRNI